MKISRLYSGPDGQTHIEWMALETHPQLATPQGATTIVFRRTEAGHFMDWHPAPRRQFVIILSGQLEIGCGDGSKHLFGPGDARLVEDTTGKGHTTRQIGNEPCVTATVPLAKQEHN